MPRRLIIVKGVVQGVGFRPFVFGLASRLRLDGFVRNDSGSVMIEVEGEDGALDTFVTQLSCESPPLARIDDVKLLSMAERGEKGFSILRSIPRGSDTVLVSPDIATCDQCLAELTDPVDRRFNYAFLNCTNCGPRLTIIAATPYDRPRTTMAAFPLCPDCREEYEDPADRRFHAQPIACPACGPRLVVLDAEGTGIETGDPLRFAAERLLRGAIIGLKSLGGYHLVCNAQSQQAVMELRQRKQRDAKPFAIMLGDLVAARRLCEISEREESLLTSWAAPIVLLRRRPKNCVAEAVAPQNPCLGVMLANTPLHHLLLQAVSGIPLVMTSGNRIDEPIAFDDRSYLSQLGGLADLFLTHDRPIQLRCDDSVVRVVAERTLPIRRARGYAPAPIPLPIPCPVGILALGGQLKSTFALGRNRQAILSHHLGDLDHYEAFRAYGEAVEHYERLFAIEPAIIAHDLHPHYATTLYARNRKTPIAQIGIQHHHAHLASCLAEHGLNEVVIGVIFDGTGYGPDDAVWGGEFLIGDYCSYRRAAHMRYVPMPGGEKAIREPWRMGAAHLLDAGLDLAMLNSNVSLQQIHGIQQMIRQRFNTPLTSSIGRLFDAVAAILGVRSKVHFEGHAAMELESLASQSPICGSYPFSLQEIEAEKTSPPMLDIDTRPLIAAIADDLRRGEKTAAIARRFHSTLVELIVCVCHRLRHETSIEIVALSGGVFMNAILLSESVERLTKEGFRVYRHELVPPNDGGLSLGQLAIAAALYAGDNAAR